MTLRETYGGDEIHERWQAKYRRNRTLDKFNDAIALRIFDCRNEPPNALFLTPNTSTMPSAWADKPAGGLHRPSARAYFLRRMMSSK